MGKLGISVYRVCKTCFSTVHLLPVEKHVLQRLLHCTVYMQPFQH
jgi:hypothetical protein